MTYLLKPLSQFDLDLLADFIWNNSIDLDQKEISSVASVKNKLVQQAEDHKKCYLFAWIEQNKFQGTLYLYTENDTYFLMNPGFIGSYPIIASNLDYGQTLEVLYAQCLLELRKNHLEISSIKYELNPNYLNNIKTQKIPKMLESAGFSIFYSKLQLELSEILLNNSDLIPSIRFGTLKDADLEDLYQCYYNTFKVGDLEFFHEQNDLQRREFFEELLSPSMINLSASVIMKIKEKIIGFGVVWNYSETEFLNAHLNLMCLLPEFQHKGYGIILMDRMVKLIKALNIPTFSLYTENEGNAFRFYSKYGFKGAIGWKTYQIKLDEA